MSNGENPASTASYIIICSGRIAAGADPRDPIHRKIKAASDCAAQLVTYLAVRAKDKLTPAHTKEISQAQHFLMVNMATMSENEVETEVKDLFKLLYKLEKQFDGF